MFPPKLVVGGLLNACMFASTCLAQVTSSEVHQESVRQPVGSVLEVSQHDNDSNLWSDLQLPKKSQTNAPSIPGQLNRMIRHQTPASNLPVVCTYPTSVCQIRVNEYHSTAHRCCRKTLPRLGLRRTASRLGTLRWITVFK